MASDTSAQQQHGQEQRDRRLVYTNPPPAPRSPERIVAAKKKTIDKKLLTVHNPKWCLAKRQLIDMWNMEAAIWRPAKEYRREYKRAKYKMLAPARKYELNEVYK
ncbi:uncharacterized protein Z519_09472 [Cladophialophora bantiana CBS 173.52]|uniref:Uncharacterized protein n=1 Tax=Cladophialophora bantiana (strain ATCC 10958 / CBS 173.52 / CDC B-1940 / NIH 8579) TaxID=1442370 RepID=A0A0D2FU34_CLAB1|nr:uncharacterized protein Z519_09472 [Cladophialophora bantiana CBS 173.52]KIW90042.1 hypothetical protein Z519_09472 [Cladophialophora bantiana CBS 173.52]